jgi:hypothetical protein
MLSRASGKPRRLRASVSRQKGRAGDASAQAETNMQHPARATLPLLILFGLSACARGHGEIAPEPIPPFAYEPATCRELSLMRAKTVRARVLSDIRQDWMRAEDRTRVFGVPLPMASIFEENREAEVARLKGESLALATQLQRAGCVAREG